jgi:PIN domain nuclease of toxin-antitoxin system
LRLLLDTHIWLWSLLDPNKLGRRVQHELQNAGNEFWLSSISVWEATVLIRKGRLQIPGDREAWLQRSIQQFREAAVTHEIAMAAGQMQMHPDPADRFLAATAQVLGLTLVTADEKLLGLGDIKSLANR